MLVFATAVVASACRSSAEPTVTATASGQTPKAAGTLAQVMRGIYFPNANLLFDVQQKDPGAPPGSGAEGARGSVTEQFASIYTGWQVVENAAISIAESTDLLMVPGRHCQNGKPVPIERPGVDVDHPGHAVGAGIGRGVGDRPAAGVADEDDRAAGLVDRGDDRGDVIA